MSVIETILERAIADPDFQQHLLRDPAGAAASAGFVLSAAEFGALQEMLGGEQPQVERLQPRGAHGYGVEPTPPA